MNTFPLVPSGQMYRANRFQLTSKYRGGDADLPARLHIYPVERMYDCDRQMRILTSLGMYPAIIVDEQGGFLFPYYFRADNYYAALKMYPIRYTETLEKWYATLIVKELIESMLFWHEVVRDNFKIAYNDLILTGSRPIKKNMVTVTISCKSSHKAVLDDLSTLYPRVGSFLSSDDDIRKLKSYHCQNGQVIVHGKPIRHSITFIVELDHILPTNQLIDLSDFDKAYEKDNQTTLLQEFLK